MHTFCYWNPLPSPPLPSPPPEEQSQRRQNDADLARQLQSQFDNRVMEEQRDAELAQQLQQETPPPLYQAPPPPYQAPATYPADSVDEDARLAQQLQEEEQRHQMNEGGDARLARRLQEEEQRHKMNEGGGVPGPDNEMVHQRVPDNELYGDGFNPPGSYSIPQDSYPDPSSSYPNPYDPHSSTPGFYPTAYRDDEQPRPKTPPPAAKKVGSKRKTHTNSENPYEESEESEGKIPCQFCHKLFPFAVIMHHQVGRLLLCVGADLTVFCLLSHHHHSNAAQRTTLVAGVGVSTLSTLHPAPAVTITMAMKGLTMATKGL